MLLDFETFEDYAQAGRPMAARQAKAEKQNWKCDDPDCNWPLLFNLPPEWPRHTESENKNEHPLNCYLLCCAVSPVMHHCKNCNYMSVMHKNCNFFYAHPEDKCLHK